MKYYTVSLYDVKYTEYQGDSYDGQKVYVDEIIVKAGLLYATELLTGRKIEILPEGSYDKFGVLDDKYRDEAQAEELGYHLVVLGEDFTTDNLTTTKEIDIYVDYFDCSRYSDIYSDIKAKTQGEKSNKELSLRQKIKAVKGTKK